MGISCFGSEEEEWGFAVLSLDDSIEQPTATFVPLYDESTVELLIQQAASRDILDKKFHNSPALDSGDIALSPVIYLPLEMALEETTEHNKQDKTIINNPLTISLPTGNNSSLQKDSEDEAKGEITPSSVAYIPGDYNRKKRFKCVAANKKNLVKEDVTPEDKIRRKRSRVITESDLSEEDNDEHTRKTTKSQPLQGFESDVLADFNNYVF